MEPIMDVFVSALAVLPASSVDDSVVLAAARVASEVEVAEYAGAYPKEVGPLIFEPSARFESSGLSIPGPGSGVFLASGVMAAMRRR